MKNACAVMVLCFVAAGMMIGCASVDNGINKVESFIAGTVVPDTCKAATYYQQYIEGVVTAAEAFPAVGTIIGPYVTLVNTGIEALVANYNNGALAATISADITKVDGYIQEINTLVGNAKTAGVVK